MSSPPDDQEGRREAGEEDRQERRLGPFQVVGSVLAAAFGVQSSRNRQRDFKEGRFLPFIITGVVFTALFIGGLYLVVSTVLENAR